MLRIGAELAVSRVTGELICVCANGCAVTNARARTIRVRRFMVSAENRRTGETLKSSFLVERSRSRQEKVDGDHTVWKQRWRQRIAAAKFSDALIRISCRIGIDQKPVVPQVGNPILRNGHDRIE